MDKTWTGTASFMNIIEPINAFVIAQFHCKFKIWAKLLPKLGKVG